MIGNVIGTYEVVEKIGEGGMGAVYKGVDLMLEREVAIKVLKPELASQTQVAERFRTEAVTLAKLNHPNIATLYNFFLQGDQFFMVMEYVNGTPLNKIIEACGVMTCEQAIPLFCQMMEGIDHAHAFGIVHRDIKPGNMMLTENGLLKVLDFGIARALGTARMTKAGHLIGTLEYMSPEQVRGMDTDARSDIYSLGMVLYEMLTGRVPFVSDSEFELMKAQVEQLPTPPREFVPNIPEAVEWAILCATEKDPRRRFQTAGAFAGAIVDSVNTAIAAGTLSQIDMRRGISRLGPAFAVGDFPTTTRTNSLPGSATGGSGGTAETESQSAETQYLPATTRVSSPGQISMPTSASVKPTVVAEATNFNCAASSDAREITTTAAAPVKLKQGRKHYVAWGILGGVLILGVIGLVVSLVLLRASRAGGAKVEAAPPAAAPANTTNTEPQQTPGQVQDTTAMPNGPGTSDNSDGNSAKESTATLSEADNTSKSTSTPKIAKSRNDAAARARARAAREALNHK